MDSNSLIIGDLFTAKNGMRGWCIADRLRSKLCMYWNLDTPASAAISMLESVSIEGRAFDLREAIRWIRDGELM